MKKILGLITVIAGICLTPTSQAEDTKVTYKFEKGHVIDFLLLTRKPNSDEALFDYGSAAIAKARALGYKGLSGFNVTRNPIQSNFHPETITFASWPGSFEDREAGIAKLLEQVPDLYSKRLNVWSSFYLSYYEIEEDISFDVYHDKIQILSAFWRQDSEKFTDFQADYFQKVNRYGGDIKFNLSGAKSPFGFDYTPDFTTLIEWDSQEDFDAFRKATEAFDENALKQVHQFYLTPPKPKT
jgi:hypothetical protein